MESWERSTSLLCELLRVFCQISHQFDFLFEKENKTCAVKMWSSNSSVDFVILSNVPLLFMRESNLYF